MNEAYLYFSNSGQASKNIRIFIDKNKNILNFIRQINYDQMNDADISERIPNSVKSIPVFIIYHDDGGYSAFEYNKEPKIMSVLQDYVSNFSRVHVPEKKKGEEAYIRGKERTENIISEIKGKEECSRTILESVIGKQKPKYQSMTFNPVLKRDKNDDGYFNMDFATRVLRQTAFTKEILGKDKEISKKLLDEVKSSPEIRRSGH